jgi:hypothetical protein
MELQLTRSAPPLQAAIKSAIAKVVRARFRGFASR